MLVVIVICNMIEMFGFEIVFLLKSFMKGKSFVDFILLVRLLLFIFVFVKLDLILVCFFCDYVRDGGRLGEVCFYIKI